MKDHEAALAELDTLGGRAASALHAALEIGAPSGEDVGATITERVQRSDGQVVPASGQSTDPDDVVEEPVPVVVSSGPAPLRPADRRRRRRPLLVAAVLVAVAGMAAATALRRDDRPTAHLAGSGAPTAALGTGDDGIYPPDADHRGADPGHVDWLVTIPPAGEHMIVDLPVGASGDRVVSVVMADLGAAPLQVGAVDADGEAGSGNVAVYGVVRSPAEAGAAYRVTVEWPGAQPVDLVVDDIPGATHDAFVGLVPSDVGADAEVVARAPGGEEVARAPLGWTGRDVPFDGPGGIYPPGVDPGTVTLRENGDPGWQATVLSGGHHVLQSVSGNGDVAKTVFDAPGSHPLQVLATRLEGEAPDGAVDVAVYGMVEAAAARVELVRSGADPMELQVKPIEGASHNAFVGFVAEDVDDSAYVVAYDADGVELARQPLAWTIHDSVDQGG